MSEPQSWKRVALGLFILFQLVYLPAANIIKLVPLRLPECKGELNDDIQLRGKKFIEPVQVVADAVGAAFERWGELTGQRQGWSLFAPHFGHQASLPVVSWPGKTIASSFMPDDPNSYFRPPRTFGRLFNYEYRLGLLYWTWSEASYRDQPSRWRDAAIDRVRRQTRSMLAFMRWRVDHDRILNPAAGLPSEITITAQMIPPPAPEFARPPQFGFRLARWQPNAVVPPGYLPVQAGYANADWIWLAVEGEP
jgi:hypothetical protein